MGEDSPEDGLPKVGRGQPPLRSQWTKGGPSPNPKGRPSKKSRSLEDYLETELDRLVSVMENGVEKRLPMSKVVVRAVCAKAAKGHGPSLRFLSDNWPGRRAEQEASKRERIDEKGQRWIPVDDDDVFRTTLKLEEDPPKKSEAE